MLRIDLHTHSQASPDGGLSIFDYRRILEQGKLDYIAVTDHDTIEFARKIHLELGDHIIVGEEIMTREGEIVGLYLSEAVRKGLSARAAAAAIHDQGGLVYIPHPFSNNPKGLSMKTLDSLFGQVDIVEVYNGRAIFHNSDRRANAWAIAHNKVIVASSDAHGSHGWGNTYTSIEELPSKENLVRLLKRATIQKRFVGPRGALYPKINRIKKKINHV